MLGTIDSARDWWWSAAGKHPVAKDYIRLGHLSPFADGFADWVRSGYLALRPRGKRPVSEFRSWRFWARGFGKEAIACGVVSDSSDALGRQYPFLVLGNGPLAGWESRWDLLPLACDGTWRMMESLSLSIPDRFERLEERVLHEMCPPLPEWSDHAARRESLEENGGPGSDRTVVGEEEFAGRTARTEVLVDLGHGTAGDSSASAVRRTRFLKDRLQSVPSALFLGGAREKAHLALFLRPLNISDFVRLWSLSPDGKPQAKEGGVPATAT